MPTNYFDFLLDASSPERHSVACEIITSVRSQLADRFLLHGFVRVPPFAGVTKGDTVMLPEYGGQPLKLGDKELFLYRDEEILGLMEQP